MLNILDYIVLNNKTFEEERINEVDMLILSFFTMLKFKKVLKNVNTDENNLSFQDILDYVTSLTKLEDYNYISDLYKAELFDELVTAEQDPKNLEMLKLLCSSRRFRNLQIRYHVDKYDLEAEKQFSATCFIYKNRFSVMSFRGTDATLVGWKEDFNLSYKDVIEAQLEAVQYINTIYTFLPEKLYVCGHSKGGNLAVYAAMYCNEKIRRNIEHVYSYDGPGFNDIVARSDEYAAILEKTTKIVPSGSVVGMVLNTEEEMKVLRSNAFWVLEHDPYSWEIKDDLSFNYLPELSNAAKISHRRISGLNDNLSREDKELILNDIYNIFISTGAETFTDLKRNYDKYLPVVLKEATKLDRKHLEIVIDILKNMAKYTFTK